MIADLAIQRTATLKEQSYRQIRDLLTSGELTPDRLYSASQLAERLRVSRTPVREALLQLEAEGLLVQLDGRGFQPKRHSRKEAQDFFETRRLFELFALKGMASARRSEDLVRLTGCLETMSAAARAGDRVGFMRADEAFHLAIIKGCGNSLLETLWRNICNLIAVFGSQAILREERMDEALAEHKAVLDALQQHEDACAIACLQHHLDATQARLMESFPY